MKEKRERENREKLAAYSSSNTKQRDRQIKRRKLTEKHKKWTKRQ